jgi:hypothetical protein
MPTAEEFDALKKQVNLLQTNFNILAASHKKLLEVTFPSGMDTLTRFIEITDKSQTAFAERLSQVMNGLGELAKSVEVIQLELDLKAD